MTYESALLALADPTRRQVFEHLRSGPRAAGEIAAEMPVSRPAVSQHLKVLKAAGLVTDQAAGTRRVYYIDPQGLGALRSWLDQFWDTALEAFKAEVGQPKGPRMNRPSPRVIPVAPVRKTVRVNADVARAFDVFTAGFSRWWPHTHHIGAAEMKDAIIEPRVGGRWYERGDDGSECE